MSFRTILRLGRVSNLPTVWSNALAGALLAAGAPVTPWPLFEAALALSLFYIGGMWLNDAFDAEVDARERKERPIPAGEIGRASVFVVGVLLLASGLAIGFALGVAAGAAAAVLTVAVLLYDWAHKKTPLSPLVMGAARFLCYVVAALAVGALSPPVLIGASGLFAYVVGLTYAARHEAGNDLGSAWPLAVLLLPVAIALGFAGTDPAALAFCAGLLVVMGLAVRRLIRRAPGDVPRAVVMLIAGISLYDAALIAGAGLPLLALLGVVAFVLTLVLQRLAPGT
ncbi:UbiA family prenyltransferase [Nitratireductor sp. GCM10026969]|uniref:UbiA family prenyltransferase n=1 Tax=Nitratireductor sp. GCM10026969 TaxID=3252645 RepID=UPI0036122821